MRVLQNRHADCAVIPHESHPRDVAFLSSCTQCMGIAWLIMFSPSPKCCCILALHRHSCNEMSQHPVRAKKYPIYYYI